MKCAQWKTHCASSEPFSQLNTYPKTFSKRSCAWNYEQKKRVFNLIPAERMKLITPSKWLANLVGESFLSKYPVEVRHNTIDTTVFKPTPSDFRERHDIGGRFMILGVASPWTERKGLGDFVRLAAELDSSKYAIVLVGLSDRQIKELPSGIIGLARTDSSEELAGIYLEAEACGTPVVTYDTGGCPETVRRELSNIVSTFDSALEQIKNSARSFF